MECEKPLTTKNDAFVRPFAETDAPLWALEATLLRTRRLLMGFYFFLMTKSTLPFLARTRFFVRDLGSSLPSLTA